MGTLSRIADRVIGTADRQSRAPARGVATVVGVTKLDPPIQAFFDATNAGDAAAFLDAFADDAELIDWGRTFRGRDAIARWNDGENIGVQAHVDVTSAERTPSGSVLVGVQVTGNGYNGGGSFEFDAAEGQITRVQIRG